MKHKHNETDGGAFVNYIRLARNHARDNLKSEIHVQSSDYSDLNPSVIARAVIGGRPYVLEKFRFSAQNSLFLRSFLASESCWQLFFELYRPIHAETCVNQFKFQKY